LESFFFFRESHKCWIRTIEQINAAISIAIWRSCGHFAWWSSSSNAIGKRNRQRSGYHLASLLKCIVINLKSLSLFFFLELELSTRASHHHPIKADGCALGKTVTLWICVQCIVWVYEFIRVRRYSGGSQGELRCHFWFLAFFCVCELETLKRLLRLEAQLAKDKSWRTTMSRAFKHFLLLSLFSVCWALLTESKKVHDGNCALARVLCVSQSRWKAPKV